MVSLKEIVPNVNYGRAAHWTQLPQEGNLRLPGLGRGEQQKTCAKQLIRWDSFDDREGRALTMSDINHW